MIKNLACLVFLVSVASVSNAQLSNSKWKGTLKIENDVNVSFEFGKDTLKVFNLADNSIIETMTYTATNSTFTINKISGQSDCDNAAPGKYKYETKQDALLITLLEDTCEDRSSVLKSLELSKNPE